ncbi:MAG: alginate export family protein [Magnetospirillum sp.]|nr:alginate export family protein [Magnetospirillum sp.]
MAGTIAAGGAARADSGDGSSLADTLGDAITQGQPSVQVRPRYEIVQQQGKAESQAATVRTLVGYSTKPMEGLGATLQFIDVAVLDTDTYNIPGIAGVNGVANHPSRANIPDPRAANVNQAFVSYEGLSDTRMVAGRQIITLDDQRFVGNVDFRQNMQTFDAVSASNQSLPDVKLFGAYLFGLKDILNQEVDQNTYLAEANWTRFEAVQVDGFGYWYGNESNLPYTQLPGAAGCYIATTARSCNSATYGGRLHGSLDFPAGLGVDYVGEYARQVAYDGGDPAIDAAYGHGGGKLKWKDVFLGADYMVMGSNGGRYGFQTPLATKHAFNGWAEMFLTTPKEGLRSAYATGGAKLFGSNLLVRCYAFRSDYQDKDFGHEWDFSWTYPVTPHITGGLEYAKYHASNAGFADTSGGLGALANTNAMWAFVSAGF